MISAGLYPASGDSADWAYHALSISDAYTFELRDTGKHGFVLPPEQVKLSLSLWALTALTARTITPITMMAYGFRSPFGMEISKV